MTSRDLLNIYTTLDLSYHSIYGVLVVETISVLVSVAM